MNITVLSYLLSRNSICYIFAESPWNGARKKTIRKVPHLTEGDSADIQFGQYSQVEVTKLSFVVQESNTNQMLTVRDVMALGDCQKGGHIEAQVLRMKGAPDIVHIYGNSLKVQE